MKKPVPMYFTQGDELPRTPPAPARPTFGFLLGGTTLGIFFGCILLCAGATPASVILILLSTLGAFTGGLLESFWPKPDRGSSISSKSAYNDISVSPFRDDRHVARPGIGRTRSAAHRECHRCGEVFEPCITCPMCGHSEKT